MAGTWHYFNWDSLDRSNPLTWHFDFPLWPFLLSIQPPQPAKISGPDAVDLIVQAIRLGRILASPKTPETGGSQPPRAYARPAPAPADQ